MLIETGIATGAFIGGFAINHLIQMKKASDAKNTAKGILDKAKRDAERTQKNAKYKAKEEMQAAFDKIKKEKRAKQDELASMEKNLVQQEIKLQSEIDDYKKKQTQLEDRETELREQLQKTKLRETELNEIVQKEMIQLENISQFTADQARQWIIDQVKTEARAEAAEIAMQIKNESRERANREAKDVLAKAIENNAYEYTIESTLTTIPLPSDRTKGMLIGREGKNIRALEEITGVKLIIDDTPESVTISGYDPIKRDIASRTILELIANKVINPKEIERIWKRKKVQIEKEMRKAAADCLRELKIRNVSDEMFEMLGRLKYRTSYGQNILQHSMEVAKLAGHMAAELGLDANLAKRAGLFHDLGKANSHDAEASHVAIGVEVCTRAKEHPVVINAVLSHHEEAEPISPISVLVNAADKISGSRPGARRDSLEQYTQRISSLEKIASSQEGVNKVFAMSAGREVRVIVEPTDVTDAQAEMLSSDIAKEIQANMEYPGQIKVTVVRRTIINKLTDTFSENTKRNAYKPNPQVEQLEKEVETREE